MNIGFAIMSHAEQKQLLRLVQGLNEHYRDPPIACHHDESQSPLDRSPFPANVRFVENPRRTGWGRWSVVEAGLAAIGTLYRGGGPDWFFLLSAADYPIMSKDRVLHQLESGGCDAFIDVRPLMPGDVPTATLKGPPNPKLPHYNSAGSQALKRRFYRSPQLWVPIIRRDPRYRIGKFTVRPDIPNPFHPYRNGVACFYGDHWITGNRRAAEVLLESSPLRAALAKHLRNRTQTDETFYQTILAAKPDLVLCRDNKRFAEWNGGGAHPMFLTEAQLPEAYASGAFFARKIAYGSGVVDRIDQDLRAGAE